MKDKFYKKYIKEDRLKKFDESELVIGVDMAKEDSECCSSRIAKINVSCLVLQNQGMTDNILSFLNELWRFFITQSYTTIYMPFQYRMDFIQTLRFL